MKSRKLLLTNFSKMTIAACLGLTFMVSATSYAQCSTDPIAALNGVDANNANTSDSGNLNAEADNIGDVDTGDWMTFSNLDLSCVKSVDFLLQVRMIDKVLLKLE